MKNLLITLILIVATVLIWVNIKLTQDNMNLSAQVDSMSQWVPTKEVIDCWYGTQVATPNIQSFDTEKAESSYCLVQPADNWDF